MKRACLERGCGALTDGPSRCSIHTRTTVQRGYGAAHRRERAVLIAAAPWCHWPVGCDYPDAGSATNPLTLDHVVAIANGGRHGPKQVLCHRHNSGKRDRVGGDGRPRRATRIARDPALRQIHLQSLAIGRSSE